MRLLHNISYNFNLYLNWLLRPADTLFMKEYVRPDPAGLPPPVFIIGPPRSGTTLLYQLMINVFDIAYINNFIGSLYGCPNLAARISSGLGLESGEMRLQSHRGKTAGLVGPNEFGNFWYRWFPREPHYVDSETVTAEQKAGLHRTVYSLIDYYKKPLLFKNVLHSLRIKALLDIFPEALFINCVRDPVYNAQSIVRMRRKSEFRTEKWWSVRPPEIGDPPEYTLLEQAVYQIYYVLRRITGDAEETAPSRFITVEYERVCASPETLFSEIDTFFRTHGVYIHKEVTGIPELENTNEPRLPGEDFRKLQELVNSIWK